MTADGFVTITAGRRKMTHGVLWRGKGSQNLTATPYFVPRLPRSAISYALPQKPTTRPETLLRSI